MAYSINNLGWSTEFNITCITTGSSGTVEGQGYTQFATAATTSQQWFMSKTATTTVNTTTANTLQLSAQYTTTGTDRSITLRQLIIEEL